ncbi:unnamed protein product [Schistocephalus solidus]|uniref:Integrase_SAM-like_N domain-containing protein n=1 Tax=Schistocephalus solidus TaxID=70667 RepID=A0A183T1U6_SCHSO|nr:unnamed protein product [Schistocephalus solidus]
MDGVSYCSACQVCAQIKSPSLTPRELLHPIVNHRLAELSSLVHIRNTRIIPYHPEGNALVEQTKQRTLFVFVERASSDNWDDNLPHCLLAYRTALHDPTGFSPALLKLGHELHLQLIFLVRCFPLRKIIWGNTAGRLINVCSGDSSNLMALHTLADRLKGTLQGPAEPSPLNCLKSS